MTQPVLSIRNLTVDIPTRYAVLRPVDKVSYDIAPGEILGVVGESGAGKSMAGNAVIGLLTPPAHISSGEVWLNGKRIDRLTPEQMRRVRGKDIGMVFQDPLTSLNPLLRIGDQLTETMLAHLPISRAKAEERAVAALEEVGIPAARQRVNSYPHEFSGGMRQRVVIALALCAEPSLVIADEPTTALDVSVQAQIIALLKRLCRERGTAVMLITHDMGVIAEAADRVAVMYAGRLAELGPVRAVLTAPRHPYTFGLMGSTPLASKGLKRLHQIPGSMPRLGHLPPGCAFSPRCPRAQDKCRVDPGPVIDADGAAACWFPMDGTEGIGGDATPPHGGARHLPDTNPTGVRPGADAGFTGGGA
ncbi:ABC transporter ATP-binding protein [Dinoroseobacter sp. PD6]|uniref:ABC transporter ATP-binding protein n=1 Tax=Dinoroseobacter sp. PD6 TaxID=3028384 RepID=UPI00237A20B1|nr:ABC transporter ATP-binding protein [Dinoroseobacter sp. PD6]MDD9718415.1 ABC transporter ATP-binding protein [Dinoroseobacter sp. PD6]